MSKSQKKGPAFLLKTFDMLEKQQFRQIIDWISDGSGFVVKNSNELAQKVLPKYFKHSNMHSFIRQLNMYGFNKRRSSKIQNYYYHPLFKKGQRDMIGQMQRKAQKKGMVVKQLSRQQVNGQCQVSIQIQQMSRQQNKQNKMINNDDILISGQISNRMIGKQLNKQQQLNNLTNINISNNNLSANNNNLSANNLSTNNKVVNRQLQQRQIKRNILQLTLCNKVLLLQQIYNLANIESNNLLSYKQRLMQQLDGESNYQYQKQNQLQKQRNDYLNNNKDKDNQILQRFKHVKNKYLQIHSFVWDKINSVTQQLHLQSKLINEPNNECTNQVKNECNNNMINECNNKYKQIQIQISNNKKNMNQLYKIRQQQLKEINIVKQNNQININNDQDNKINEQIQLQQN